MQTNKTNFILEVIQDENPESPREWDNIGIMACAHKRYTLGDKTAFPFDDLDGWEACDKYAKETLGALVVLPLYLYDHSGITMKTTPFGCQWDSGRVGLIYTTKEQCTKMGTDPNDLEALKKYLEGEVTLYDKYLTGDVWGYVIKETKTCNLGHEHEEEINSCYGFYGQEEAEEAGQEEIKAYK